MMSLGTCLSLSFGFNVFSGQALLTCSLRYLPGILSLHPFTKLATSGEKKISLVIVIVKNPRTNAQWSRLTYTSISETSTMPVRQAQVTHMHTHMYVHGGLGGSCSPIWPTWAKAEEGMLIQRKTGMLLLEKGE